MIDSNVQRWMSTQGLVIRRPYSSSIGMHWAGTGVLEGGNLRDKYSYLDTKLTYPELEELDEYMKQFEWT
jgi:hypothetical protein